MLVQRHVGPRTFVTFGATVDERAGLPFGRHCGESQCAKTSELLLLKDRVLRGENDGGRVWVVCTLARVSCGTGMTIAACRGRTGPHAVET